MLSIGLRLWRLCLPPAGQVERAEEAQRRLHFRGNNTRDPFPFAGFHNGFSTNEYEDWEIVLDNRFSQCRMCERRKIKVAISYLTSYALT